MSAESELTLQELQELVNQSRREAEEAKRLLRQANQQVEESNRRAQETTFEEFLKTCHEHLHKALRIERNLAWTTKGFTKPKNRYYPRRICPWESFPEVRQQVFDQAYCWFHPSDRPAPRKFGNISYYERIGQDHCGRRLTSEGDLQFYERLAVEDQVTQVIRHLCENVQARKELKLEKGITFENHINSLSDLAEEVQQMALQTPRQGSQLTTSVSSSGSESDSSVRPKKPNADQFCVFKNQDSSRQLAFLVEYKPPFRLSADNLTRGFRPLDFDYLLSTPTMPPQKEEGEDPAVTEARLQYTAEQLVAAVVTQTFDYMIRSGLEYSYITTGEAFVFLHVREDDPSTAYYHLTMPGEDIDEAIDERYPESAIGQVLSLALMSFQSKQRTHSWRHNAKKGLKKWNLDLETMLARIPATERKQAPTSSYKGRKNPNPKQSPYHTRSKTIEKENARARMSSSCASDDKDPFLDDDEPEDPDAPASPRSRRSRKGNLAQARGKVRGEPSDGQNSTSSRQGRQRQYCTQDCLLGMVRGLRLDETCPNASLHPRDGTHHAIGLTTFMELIQAQLKETLDVDCHSLDVQGARGALFWIALTSHGYVFVGKGTVRAFIPTLLHEGKMYQRLETLQGAAIPVYLGNINLRRSYYLDLDVKIKHMLLLSYGGKMIDDDTSQTEVWRTVGEVKGLGVDHGDVRWPNMLWNEEKERVMLIDFERARYFSNEPATDIVTEERALQGLPPDIVVNKPSVTEVKDQQITVFIDEPMADPSKDELALQESPVSSTVVDVSKDEQALQELSPNKKWKRSPSPKGRRMMEREDGDAAASDDPADEMAVGI